MDAILKSQAEHLAREMGTRVTTLDDLNGLMRAMMTTARERMLNTEMDVHLGRRTETTVTDNPTPDAPTTNATERVSAAPKSRRNGHSQKTVSGDLGDLQLRTPRDRNGTFEPQLVATGPRRLDGFDEKILPLYAKGLTTRDIQDIVKDLYGVEVSPARVSEITTDLDAEVTAWRTRRLEGVWPIVYLDGIVVHVRGENGRVSPHTMYVAIGVNLQGRKELLGLWLSEAEGPKFWLSCLTDLKSRGVSDMFVVCVDGLSGLPEAIRAAFPRTKVQLCIVHRVRAARKYVTDSDSREVAADLKTIYPSATVLEAEEARETFATKWDAKYPTIVRPWRATWADIVTRFEFPGAIRKAIYTTNALESVNRVIRTFTRNRKPYPNAGRARKLVYLAIHEASKTWTMPIVGWKAARNHFAIVFEGRMPTRPPN
ncbi:transposase mutator type : Transposase OS=Neosynechococcus sphagnicola sy1 GN=DO97_10765 PE=4 SV=1: Transposase_mut [Gemmata massiliana]|uniref:Mutator family transposase n=1 Tax=Gemmata massiliana TaxID=1210884 RepID=A0A6P2CSX7_9BACT|nr:IS256 family transposase [Gemmata massiliana]VTR92031.1 transposase mutator type : Transposase OS=Neosynechococcus sphagnicola sy1 GN=DO97_10765 PE=4 SV=1: Transposase_mut [Gemmata massiliana]